MEHLDILIVGAGLSGIGAACHLQTQHPGKRYAILESRRETGGTWSLFQYPGMRSDSDMYTFGYSFRPWTGAKSISDGPSILTYLREEAAHVTMLQRSPSYITALPAKDVVAELLRKVLPLRLAYRVARTKVILVTMFFYELSRRFPALFTRLIRGAQKKRLPADYDIDAHFKPHYKPWDQRVCVAPDGDLFDAIKAGRASIVTEHIDGFTEQGIRLKSGRTLPADIIVSATGLKLKALGGIRLGVDGVLLDMGKIFTYKGIMLGNVPNMAFCVGYTNASWTLRADLSSLFICRLLNYMDQHGYRRVGPKADDEALQPPIPLLSFTSGYVLRSLDQFPKQSGKAPWRLRQNYLVDLLNLRLRPIDDGTLVFSA